MSLFEFEGEFELETPLDSKSALALKNFHDFGCQFSKDFIYEGIHFPKSDQPKGICYWVATPDNKSIKWSGIETFENFFDWLIYLIDKFFNVYGFKLNGTIRFVAKIDKEPFGDLICRDNNLKLYSYKYYLTYPNNFDINDC